MPSLRSSMLPCMCTPRVGSVGPRRCAHASDELDTGGWSALHAPSTLVACSGAAASPQRAPGSFEPSEAAGRCPPPRRRWGGAARPGGFPAWRPRAPDSHAPVQHQGAPVLEGRPATRTPPHGQRSAFPACRTHLQCLRPAAAAVARRVHLAWRDCPMQRMPCVAAPGQAQPRCTSRSAHVSRFDHPCGGAGRRRQRGACVLGAGGTLRGCPLRCGCAVAYRAADPPARPPPTPPDPRKSAAPIGAGHILAGHRAGPPPGEDGRRGVNSTERPRCPRCAVAQTRGIPPRPPAARRPATCLRRFHRGTRPVPGPRRPPPTGHTATVLQHCGTGAEWAMQTRF